MTKQKLSKVVKPKEKKCSYPNEGFEECKKWKKYKNGCADCNFYLH